MTPLAHMHAQELRDTWQGRALAEAKGTLGAVLQAVLFHNYRDAMPVLWRVVHGRRFRGVRDLPLPFLYGCATITADGSVTCGGVDRDGGKCTVRLYAKSGHLLAQLRELADHFKLGDAERRQLFEAVQNWITLDLRIDHLGRRVA